MDFREFVNDFEESLKTAIHGEMKKTFFALPVIVTQASDGHTVQLKSAIKGSTRNPDGTVTPVEYPLFQDVPVHFPGGGNVTTTHPVAVGDEGLIIFSSRPQDAWHQSGGVQMPIDDRMHSMSDGRYIPGGRSNPRKLTGVSTDSHQTRSDDGKHVVDVHPTNGTTIKIADPSDTSDNPFTSAVKFFKSIFHPTDGISHEATDGSNTHKVSVDHSNGPLMQSENGSDIHSVQAHPKNGVSVKSTVSIGFDSPSMSFPPGAIAGALGALTGDLGGTMNDPQVLSLNNVNNAHTLPNYASDSAAAAAGLAIGKLYRNGNVIQVRIV